MEVQTTSKSFGKKRRERYSCSFCGKLYLTKQGLELHRPSHMGIKPFICSYCNKGFSQNGVLKVRGEYCWLFRALYVNVFFLLFHSDKWARHLLVQTLSALVQKNFSLKDPTVFTWQVQFYIPIKDSLNFPKCICFKPNNIEFDSSAVTLLSRQMEKY